MGEKIDMLLKDDSDFELSHFEFKANISNTLLISRQALAIKTNNCVLWKKKYHGKG